MERKIFIVDDDQQVAELISEYLHQEHFDVEMFHDGQLALRRASICPPDVLISDVAMPVIDGITLAGLMHEQNPNCKVILISGNPEWKTQRHIDGDGTHGFVLLLKPFPLIRLLHLIKSE